MSSLGVFQVYRDRRILSILLFGFSSGLPLLLVGPTLSAWLRDEGIPLTDIGLVTLVGLVYGLKFLWAPLVDRLPIPLLTHRLGRRRAWLLVAQAGLIGTLPALGAVSPRADLSTTVALATLVAFLSATQDIVVDAYRTEVLEERRLGAGAAAVQFGYRIGMLVAGGGCLVLADHLGWAAAYGLMGALMTLGVLATLASREPAVPLRPFATGDLSRRVREAVIGPLKDFARRRGWPIVLLFVALYRYGDTLLGVMANPFYLDIGFTKTEIGVISKVFGLVMTLLGTAVAGGMVARFGIVRTLIVGGVFQAASNLMFVFQAVAGHSVPALVATIGVENASGGLASGAFVAYLSSLCNVAFTATQYALLSSIAAFGARLLGSLGGVLADRLTWAEYFLLTTLAAIPGLALLVFMTRRYRPTSATG